jgi:hypothetical protein
VRLDRGEGCQPACQRRNWAYACPFVGKAVPATEQQSTAEQKQKGYSRYVQKGDFRPPFVDCYPAPHRFSHTLITKRLHSNTLVLPFEKVFKETKALFSQHSASNCLPQKATRIHHPRAHTAKQGKDAIFLRHKRPEHTIFVQKSGAILLGFPFISRLSLNLQITTTDYRVLPFNSTERHYR